MLVYFFNLFSTLISTVHPNVTCESAEVYLLLKLDDKEESPSTMSSVFSWISSVVGSLKSRCFESQFLRVFGGWDAGIWKRWGFWLPRSFGDTFCRRANFWRFFISGVIVSGFSTVLVFCGTTAEGQPEKLHLKVVGLGFVWGTQLNQQIMTCRVEIDFNISQYTYVNPMWNGASISFGLVLVALFLVRIHVWLVLL